MLLLMFVTHDAWCAAHGLGEHTLTLYDTEAGLLQSFEYSHPSGETCSGMRLAPKTDGEDSVAQC
jgi:hypothetical protein